MYGPLWGLLRSKGMFVLLALQKVKRAGVLIHLVRGLRIFSC